MELEREVQGDIPRIFAIVDTETTGLRAATGRIIDIAVIRIEDGVVTKTFQSLVNPGMQVAASSYELTGIDPEAILRAPSFDDIAGDLLPLFQGATFVAHNAAFDYSFLKTEFKRIGVVFERPTLCTVQLSRLLYPTSRSHNLDSVMDRHGFRCDDRHRAFPDADVVRQFLQYLQTEKTVEYEEAVQKLLYGTASTPLLERTILKELPDTSGVYFFYGKDRELLYVGKSKHIRTRVRSHFSNKAVKREMALCEQTASVEARTTHGELSALLLEASLIKSELPHYNRMTRHRSELVTLVETINEQGYKGGKLGRTQQINPNTCVLAIFRSLAQAKATLRDISREHQLCNKLLDIEKASSTCFGTQLGTCHGACVGREQAEEYNKRFDKAFKARRIRTWPYSGVIAIEEKGNDAGTGTIFFVDNWCLRGSYTYDHAGMQQFLPSASSFNYDTYKILARYILNRSNKHTIRQLSQSEYYSAIEQGSGEYEKVLVYD